MKPLAFILAISILILPLLIVDTVRGQAAAASLTPAQEYKALLSKYGPVGGNIRTAQSAAERKAAVEGMDEYARKFLALAEKHAADPIALMALKQVIQVINSTDSAAQIAWDTNETHLPTGSTDDTVGKAIAILLRDHLQSEKLGPTCDRMLAGYRLEYDEFLTAVLRENPHREVQGVACLSLAQFLYNRWQLVQLADERPDLSRRLEFIFDADYLPKLRRLVSDGLAKRIESLYERATTFDGVNNPWGKSIADYGRIGLYDLHHLSIGQLAPDTVGVDQDGKALKLDDYRGKVVLLYFWSHYCLSCRTTWPHKRSLVKELKDKPFALIGVNRDISKAAELMEVNLKEKINWKSFADVGAVVNHQWNYPANPAFFIVDHQGKIRRKWVGAPGEKVINAALESLIREAEEEAASK